ncbi:hypothetical protein MGG_05148 [Pyricularia oryzae 70-15]|uniref:Uncharacterized protein n=3 Tax=Pyricularia oryzae TaxID=318829 RepID=G4N4Q8_PYRO7|nr:uncharacterized protein MGG_05148 [Pyricularia oryzae 70-15]EHA52873.1 hypothetical protein MGG_05148 [Pyricularia oryzae 70-15]KAI7927704.1 hypothetical protein M0657_003106 [Pyricularia oryzae]KAI7930637.1 hypothetical protein M9X92_000701 [Pyricularia oryzae]
MPTQKWPKPLPQSIERLSIASMPVIEPSDPEPLNENGFLLGRVIRLEVALQSIPVSDPKEVFDHPSAGRRWVVRCRNREELLGAVAGEQGPYPQTAANQHKNEASALVLRELGLEGLQIFFREDMVTLEGFAGWGEHHGVPGLPPRLKSFIRRFRRILCPIEEFLAMTDAILSTPPAEKIPPPPPAPKQRPTCLAAIRRIFRNTDEVLRDELERTRRMAPPAIRTIPSPHVDFCELLFPPGYLVPPQGTVEEQHVDREIVVCLNSAEEATDFSRDAFLLASHAPDVMIKGRETPSYEPEMDDLWERYRRCQEFCISPADVYRNKEAGSSRRLICVFRRKSAPRPVVILDYDVIGLAF